VHDTSVILRDCVGEIAPDVDSLRSWPPDGLPAPRRRRAGDGFDLHADSSIFATPLGCEEKE